MDRLDAAILRAMLRTGEWSPVGIDPRLSPAEIADRIGSSAATVRRRLTEWRRDGFCREVVPVANPGLFGLRAHFQMLSLEDRCHCAEFEQEMGLLEGPTLGFRFGTVYAVLSVYPEAEGVERDQSRLERIRYVQRLIPPTEIALPAPDRPFRAADLRHYRRLRADPPGPATAVASRLGDSSRAGHRRLAAWVERNQVFFLPSLDFSRARGTVAWLGALLRPGVDREWFVEQMSEEYPDRIPVIELSPLQRVTPDLGDAPPFESVQFLLPAQTAHHAEREFARLGEMPGVARSILNFPTRSFALRTSFDEHLGVGEEALAPEPRPAAPEVAPAVWGIPFPAGNLAARLTSGTGTSGLGRGTGPVRGGVRAG